MTAPTTTKLEIDTHVSSAPPDAEQINDQGANLNSSDSPTLATTNNNDSGYETKTATSPTTKPSHKALVYDHGNETHLNKCIKKAHTAAREGLIINSSNGGGDADASRMTLMVSDLIHLLAVTGIGRETAVRAMAYLKDPSQPSHSQALRAAVKDRREKNSYRVSNLNSRQGSDETGEIDASTIRGKDDHDKEGVSIKHVDANSTGETVDGSKTKDSNPKKNNSHRNWYTKRKGARNYNKKQANDGNKNDAATNNVVPAQAITTTEVAGSISDNSSAAVKDDANKANKENTANNRAG